MSSPPRCKRDVGAGGQPPKLPSKNGVSSGVGGSGAGSKQQRSQSLTPIQPGAAAAGPGLDRYCSADGVCGRGGGGGGQQPPALVRSATDTRRLMMMMMTTGGGGSTEKCNSADGVILAGE